MKTEKDCDFHSHSDTDSDCIWLFIVITISITIIKSSFKWNEKELTCPQVTEQLVLLVIVQITVRPYILQLMLLTEAEPVTVANNIKYKHG